MRPLQRIPKFLDHHIVDRLHDDDLLTTEEFANVANSYEEIKDYWLEHPDQRFFQVLINLNLIEDKGSRFFTEDDNLLINYGVYVGDIYKWKSFYNKDGSLLEEPITKFIKDLDTDHINNIFKFVEDKGGTLPTIYEYALNQELERRLDEEDNT